jgi:uncharacterized protein (DUF2141 family)
MPRRVAAALATGAAVLALLGAAPAAAAGEVSVEVRSVDSDLGQVLVALYDSEATWLRKPLRGLRFEPKRGVVAGTFGDLPAGDYAVSVVHDLNGNGRMDSNALGIPVEPFAFSNNATGSFGPAKFAQARLTIGASGGAIVLDLKPSLSPALSPSN